LKIDLCNNQDKGLQRISDTYQMTPLSPGRPRQLAQPFMSDDEVKPSFVDYDLSKSQTPGSSLSLFQNLQATSSSIRNDQPKAADTVKSPSESSLPRRTNNSINHHTNSRVFEEIDDDELKLRTQMKMEFPVAKKNSQPFPD
jgi:hypothetical protein